MTLFTPGSLRFLRSLKRHNERAWFEAHRAEYEALIREPLRALVEEMDVRFARFAPEIVGDPRRSVFRIYRDVRFSKDKSPYKTHAACWFYHRDASHRVGQESHGGGAGFYLQVAPGDSFLGAGLWMPPREALGRLREVLLEHQATFERAVRAPRVRRRFGDLDDEATLKRSPKGYPADHPAARWLRYQSFTLGRALTDAQAVSDRLPAMLEADFRLLLPLVRWLNGALGLKGADRR